MTSPKKKKPLRYFYLNGNLHRKLHVNRSADTIITWCYPLRKRVTYTYTDVLKNKEPAFSTPQVCDLIGRRRTQVELSLVHGHVEKPQHTYSFNNPDKVIKYMWSEQDVMNLHDYFLTVHRGRPRNDGMVTPQAMPNKRELRAIMRQEEMLYVRGENGEFRPVWRAQDFS